MVNWASASVPRRLLVWVLRYLAGGYQRERAPRARVFALPVDAHPKALKRNGNNLWRNRIQTYDSTFGLQATDALPLHYNSKLYPIPSLAAVPVFDGLLSYYDVTNPTGSVITPVTATKSRS